MLWMAWPRSVWQRWWSFANKTGYYGHPADMFQFWAPDWALTVAGPRLFITILPQTFLFCKSKLKTHLFKNGFSAYCRDIYLLCYVLFFPFNNNETLWLPSNKKSQFYSKRSRFDARKSRFCDWTLLVEVLRDSLWLYDRSWWF